jgi:hypothetical protein
MKNIFRYLLITVFAATAFEACKEEDRFRINSSDKSIPGTPVIDSVKVLNGGARIYFTPPIDATVLQIVAEFTAASGKVFKTTASYFKDSLDVYGMGDMQEHIFHVYAENRAGNQSEKVPVTVIPKKPSIVLVHESIRVGVGFNALYVEWINELQHSVNVFVDLEFNADGEQKNVGLVYSSNKDSVRQYVRDLTLLPDEPVRMKIHVEDIYGNTTGYIENELTLLQDVMLPKDNWILPESGDSIGGVPMMFGTYNEGSNDKLKDGIIDVDDNMYNFCHTNQRGRIGLQFFDFPHTTQPVPDRNVWNLMIDLGDYYELSRIVTHQRHSMNSGNLRGHLYQDENVGYYRLWYLDEGAADGIESEIHGETVKGTWVQITEHKIPVPLGLQAVEYPRLNLLGDEAYMKPITPGFTVPIRWFRYEALAGFTNNYTSTMNNCLSEVSLYGRKANK